MWADQPTTKKKQVREVQGEITTKPYRWQANGLLALQEVGLWVCGCSGFSHHVMYVVAFLPMIPTHEQETA